MGVKLTKVISLFNQAGGVAKTTTTQNLGYHLSLRRHRVLVIDIDPQASGAMRFCGMTLPGERSRSSILSILK
nr:MULTISPECIES: ParA family protein [unclassified Nostoc]